MKRYTKLRAEQAKQEQERKQKADDKERLERAIKYVGDEIARDRRAPSTDREVAALESYIERLEELYLELNGLFGDDKELYQISHELSKAKRQLVSLHISDIRPERI